MKGLYIALEGTVGTGKSTQAKKLLLFLKEKFPGREIILTREPGGSEIAEVIRKTVQGTMFKEDMDPHCEAYLYASSRAQTLRSVVKPVLERGGIVISDRSFLTSLAYQGYARGLGIDTVLEINKEAVSDIIPDIVFYFDLDPAIGLKRTHDKEGDKFEKKDADFFRKVQKGYGEISKMPVFKERWVNISGEGKVEEVFSKIKDKLIYFLQ